MASRTIISRGKNGILAPKNAKKTAPTRAGFFACRTHLLDPLPDALIVALDGLAWNTRMI
jgi:hypothetical protein